MHPLAALHFVAVTAAFYLLYYKRGRALTIIGYLVAIKVLFTGTVLFLNALLGWDLLPFLNDIIRAAISTADPMPTRRMAPGVALGFILAACGLLLNKLPRRYSYVLPHQLILLLFVLGLLALLGYMYRAEQLYGIIFSSPMSFYSAVCFTLFALALLFLRPGRGLMLAFSGTLTGSLLLRTLIPAAIIMPSLLGIISLAGFQVGLYDSAHGLVYFVFSIIVVFVSLVVFNSYLINKRDVARLEVEHALSDSERQVSTIFENAPEAVIVIDEDEHITKWNPEASRLFGWSAEEALGQLLADLIVPEAFMVGYEKGKKRYSLSRESPVIGKTLDLKARKKDGTVIDVLIRISCYEIKKKDFFVGFVRDITERKTMEKQLQSFNELLNRQVEEKTLEHLQMLERVTDGFVALDVNLNFSYVNTTAAEMLRRKSDDMLGMHLWEVFPEGVGGETDQAISQAIKTQQHVRMYDYVQAFDMWIEINIYPSRNGVSIFMKDISLQKRKEAEILEARNLADKLIDSLPGVFYFYDMDGNFIRWNKQLEEVTGYSSEEIAAMHPVNLFPLDEQAYITKQIIGVFEKGTDNAEANFLSKDGTKTPYYFRATLIDYQGKPCLLGSGIDITERKKAESELLESEQKYKLLFDFNPLPMWILSLPGYKVIDVNQAALKQYGYTREEFLELDMPALLPQHDHEKLHAQTNRNFRGLHHSGVWRHRTKEDAIIYADIVTHDLYYQGKPARLVLAKDVTEQHLSEEKLRSSYDEIRKLTEYLQKVREQERTRISREIHDELGQLLTALKMDISWINRNIPDTQSKVKIKVQNALEYIDFTVSSVRKIASELRPAILDDLGLQAAIKWQISNFETLYNIPIEARLNIDELTLSEEYRVGFFRILQESLTNVARHAKAEKVSVELKKEDDQLKLIISDNGNGFDPAAKKNKTLGLLGMKERVEVMGGDYSIKSKPGQGTTVTVVVPLRDEE